MELTTTETPAKVTKHLERNEVLTAGQVLKAELGPDELSTAVPAGKKWIVRLEVHVTETDA